MYRMHKKKPALATTTAEWPHTTWEVTMKINNRMSVVDITAVAKRLVGPDIELYGTQSVTIAPFDDLGAKILAVMIDSAIDTVEAMVADICLPFEEEPFPA